jgi:hypothetical protein
MTKGNWKPQLKSGTAYDEVNSGLQKMIRRGKEREALILAQEMLPVRTSAWRTLSSFLRLTRSAQAT